MIHVMGKEEPQNGPVEEPEDVQETPAPPAPATSKLDQLRVTYMTSDQGPFACEMCQFYLDPGTCSVVDGQIDPQGLCNVFTPSSAGAPDVNSLPDLPEDGEDEAEIE